MPNQIVPTPTGASPFYSQTTALDGTPFILSFQYNQRGDVWYLSIATLDGDAVASGIKLVVGWDLLLKCASPSRPPGTFIVVSNTTDLSPPGLNDLAPGGRCYLDYIPGADLAALQAGTVPP